jgi:benzoate transport
MIIEDPQAIIARSPMRRAQIVAIAIAVLLNALDGFDVLSISFAAPGIAREWGIDRAALGIVLSMELIGMTVGSVVLGRLCDRIGRRPTILGCLIVMATGMMLTATANDIVALSGFRLFTGLGIGGMLAATNAVVAEHANDRRRNLAVALMAGGYPVGAVVGGTVASMLLLHHDWRTVFVLGGIVSSLCIPLALVLLPETIAWLGQRRPAGAIEQINRTLTRMGHATIEELPDCISPAKDKAALGQGSSQGLMRVTILLTLAYFAHIMTFYFLLKWAPKIVVDMGFAPGRAGFVLVAANIGGVTGSLVLSLLTQRWGVRGLTIGAMLLSTVMVAAFGRVGANLDTLAAMAAGVGVCTNAAVVGLYAIVAQSFPTSARAGGTGLVIGIGRGGAALSPIVTGYLFASGVALPMVALLLGLGSIVEAGALFMLRPNSHI